MRHAILIFCCALVLSLGTALPAHAKDGAADTPKPGAPKADGKTAVSQLSESELALLKQKITTWDSLDAGKQERIARHVLRLRKMDDAQRERFHGRLRRWRDRDHSDEPKRGRTRHRSVFLAVFGQTIDSMLRKDWPEGVALAKQHKMAQSRVAMTFVRQVLVPAIGEHEAKAALAAGFDVASLELPAKMQGKFAGMRTRARQDEKALRGLGRMLFHLRMHKLGESVSARAEAAPDADSGAVVDRMAEQVRAQWAAPYQQALDEVRAEPETFFKRAQRSDQSRKWAMFVYQLDRVAKDQSQPGIAKDADALFRRVLRERFQVTDEAIDALPARGERSRFAALSKLHPDLRMRRSGSDHERGMRGGKRGGGRRGPGDRGGPGGRGPGDKRGGADGPK